MCYLNSEYIYVQLCCLKFLKLAVCAENVQCIKMYMRYAYGCVMCTSKKKEILNCFAIFQNK